MNSPDHKLINARLLSILLSFLLSACIQDGDFEKLQTQQIDGWSYATSIDKEGWPRSIASNQISADETGINVSLSFECNRNFHLALLIETYTEGGLKAASMKTRQAHSVFGRYTVADIKAYNNQVALNWVGTEVGDKTNSIMIELAPGGTKSEKQLKLPTLKISIPTIKTPRHVTIMLDNPNTQKVFADCQFKPAFMSIKKTNKEI
jgi:hypothetical protein